MWCTPHRTVTQMWGRINGEHLRQTHAKLICSETTGGGGEDGFKHPTINSSSASTQEGTERTGGQIDVVEEGGESARERRDGGKLIEKHNNIDGKPKGMPSKHSA